MGFEHLKSLYASDEDFGVLYSAYQKHPKEDFLIQDGYLDYVCPEVVHVNYLFGRYMEVL